MRKTIIVLPVLFDQMMKIDSRTKDLYIQ